MKSHKRLSKKTSDLGSDSRASDASDLQMGAEDQDLEDNDSDLNVLTGTKQSRFKCIESIRKCIDRVTQHRAFKIFLHVFEVSLLAYANYLVVQVDQRCPLVNDEDCVVNYIDRERAGWTKKLFLASFLLTSAILLPLFYKVTYRIYGFIAIANTIYLVFFFDTKINAKSYGGVFTLVLGLLVLFYFVLFFILQLILYCFRKAPRVTATVCIVGSITFLIYFYIVTWVDSCAHWKYGLGGESIDDTVGCKIEHPEICSLDMLDGVMNFAKSQYSNCADAPTQTELIETYYKTNSKIFGLPRIQYAPFEDWNFDNFQKYILSHVIPLESMDDPKGQDLEYIIDNRVDKKARLQISVRRNETLVKERAKIKKNTGLAKNVMVLFVDTMSRARFYKKMKKTAEWFEKFYNQKSSERESFQFFKFHSVTPFTQNNVWAAYAGITPPPHPPPSPPPKNPPETFVKTYQDSGYITARATDLCDTSAINLDAEIRPYIRDFQFDYEGTAISCDPHYVIDYSYKIMSGPYSVMKRCLYGDDLFNHMMGFGEKFWRAYPTEKKLLYIEFIDAHEPTQEVIKEMDGPFVEFLERLDRDGLFNDTVILFWADHGDHLAMFPYSFPVKETFLIERGLPVMFLLLPNRMAQTYRQNVIGNKQKLLSAFQVHELLLTIPEGASSSHLEKSMLGALPNLTCEDIKVYFQPCFCTYDNVTKI